MRDPSRTPIDVLLRNLSETGALLETDEALPVGTLISLGIAGAGFHIARIVRLAPNGMAAEFMQPLDPGSVYRAKTEETIVSTAFPQMMVQHPSAASLADAKSDRLFYPPEINAAQLPPSDRRAAWEGGPPWGGLIALSAIILVLLAFLLL